MKELQITQQEILIRVPCDDQEDLRKIESWIKTSSSENRKLLITYLGLVGGNKVPVIIRRILEKLFTNKLAVLCNWTGKNNNTALKDLELIKIIRVIPSIVTSITVSSNGNSPEVKMFGGMMVDMQKGFVPMTPNIEMTTAATTNYAKSRKINQINSTKLSINERYRRLIPYMTFYYANDLVTPTTETYKNIEVEKAQIIQGSTVGHFPDRQPKKIVYSTYRNIPRYQGNRLTQYNIASANPTKIYKEITYNQGPKVSNYNPFITDHSHLDNHDYGRFVQKPDFKQNIPVGYQTQKPYLNLHPNGDPGNIQYYFSEKDHAPKYKLVPYDQTPPVKVLPQNDHVYGVPKRPIAVPVMLSKEPVYIKPRPRPQYVYDEVELQQPVIRKQPSIVSESYYEKRPSSEISKPNIVGGFKPIFSHSQTTETPAYTTLPQQSLSNFESQKQHPVEVVETTSAFPEVNDYRPNYYEYVVEQPATYKPLPFSPAIPTNTMTIGDLLNSLQLNKSIPKPITRENVASSIRTLLQVLNALKAMPQQNEVEVPVLSTPKPFVAPKVVDVTVKSVLEVTPTPVTSVEDLHDEPYLAPVNPPSQHIDGEDYRGEVSSQSFPLRPHSDDEGGTPGRPGFDYPVLTVIPATAFDCKTQRYKGFFADPETRCQVWHYCDLNGGQASFLCPNGTIFSQAALTCDWWFNVRCASTAQLYVLNESLYKYILPHSPKFPEDYSGPLVDKYLTLKFKEMEEQFKKNKNKSAASEKLDSGESVSNEETSEKSSAESEEHTDNSEVSGVSESSVVVASPGTSGNVQRLED